MRAKYIRIIDFYTEAQKAEEVSLAKKEFQEVLRVLYETQTIYNLRITEKENELGGVQTEKIQGRINRVKSG